MPPSRRALDGPPLDRRTLNRTLLARQGLLERAAARPEAMVERLVGLQAQVPRDPYITLWSRIEGFKAAALERLLLERRVVRMTLMRTTLHLVTARDAVALRTAMQAVCERAFAGSLFQRRLAGADVPAIVRAGTELLDEAPLSIAELGRALQRHWPSYEAVDLGLAVRYRVPLVQVPPRGLLSQSAPPRMTTLRAWLGPSGEISDDPDARAAAEDAAVLRYLAAFGPSTTADIRAWSWLQGAAGILDRLGDRIRWRRDDR
ncbi:MAG TPA: crosslink repair DNA glycosylase YcaQ family protein, partial [Candidatus Limnocylindrales bacterium]|nr:crosslink repair DNA glycosylase YcaQ family protein [Candidatus Limnocylindrales bacterium]